MTYIVIAPPVPATTGYAVRAQTIGEALSRIADFRFLLLAPERDDASAAATRARFPSDIVNPDPVPRLSRVATHLRATLHGRNRWMEKFRHGRPLAEIAAALQAFEPDVIVFGHTALATLIPALDVPYDRAIIEHHNVESLNYTRMRRMAKGLGKVVPAIDAYTFRRAEAISGAAFDQWAVSAPDCERLAAITGAPVALVPNVAPDAAFRIRPLGTLLDAPAVLGFMGSYSYFPNREAGFELCEISAALARQGVAHETIMLGKEAPDALRQRAAAAGVQMPGFVPDRDRDPRAHDAHRGADPVRFRDQAQDRRIAGDGDPGGDDAGRCRRSAGGAGGHGHRRRKHRRPRRRDGRAACRPAPPRCHGRERPHLGLP